MKNGNLLTGTKDVYQTIANVQVKGYFLTVAGGISRDKFSGEIIAKVH